MTVTAIPDFVTNTTSKPSKGEEKSETDSQKVAATPDM